MLRYVFLKRENSTFPDKKNSSWKSHLTKICQKSSVHIDHSCVYQYSYTNTVDGFKTPIYDEEKSTSEQRSKESPDT